MVTHPNLATALSAFQSEMPTVSKTKKADVSTKTGGKFSYTYAGLAGVTETAMPALTKHGLAFTALPESTDRGYALRGVLMHQSGEQIEGCLPISGNTPQELGSALTYMRRYLFGCLTGVVTEDDDDGAAASRVKNRSGRNVSESTLRDADAGLRAEEITRPAATRPAPSQRMSRAINGASEETGEAITPAQRGALFAAMKTAGFTSDPNTPEGKKTRLDYLSQALGRGIESTNDLTKREASKVIDLLKADTEAGASS